MAKDDWAVVVGIKSYPGLSNLDGSENDARDFCEWLTSPDGGDVPAAQVKLILSPDPPPATATDAIPTLQEIQSAFNRLEDLADERGGTVGRRLYLYLSGHGFAPAFEQAALLMANATRNRTRLHVLGKPYADWFFRSGFFEEVFLFMDCCQERVNKPTVLQPIHFDELVDSTAIDKGKRFYGFAAKWSRLAQERVMDDGKVHGVFTTALLKGLRGAAPTDAEGNITSDRLAGWLYNNMRKLLSEDAGENPDISQDPFIDYEREKPFVITRLAQVPKFKVRFHVPAASATKLLRVRGEKFVVIDQVPATSPVTERALPSGQYLAEIAADGLEQTFEVSGLGEEDVHF